MFQRLITVELTPKRDRELFALLRRIDANLARLAEALPGPASHLELTHGPITDQK